MKVPRFELEHFISRHEHEAKHLLGVSGVATLPASEWPPMNGAAAEPHDYGHVPQDPRLARAIAHARGVPEDHVLVTVGGTEALFLVPFALVEPGDRVLVESPTYPPLLQVPQALGARVETFERRFEDQWRLPVDRILAALDDDVALVSLTNPNNPTGRLTSASDLVRLAKACERVDAWLLVDDIFRAAVQPAPPVSHTLHPRILTSDSLTKCHGLSGLRTGWVLAPPEVRARLRDVKALTTIVNPALTQTRAADALAHEARLVARTLRITHENLARWRAFAARHPELAWHEPDTPLITAIRLPEGANDVKFCEALLREENVLLVPGTYLGIPGFARLGFGTDPVSFAAGLEGLGRFLDR